MKPEDPTVMLIDEDIAGLADALEPHMDARLSWRMTFILGAFRLLHPLGVHYRVPAKQMDMASGRLLTIGTACWFCGK